MSIKTLTKVCSLAALLLLVFAALGPGKWIPRSGYGWQVDHFVCYFAFTLIICRAWPRAIVVGRAMTAFAVLLEALQAFTPDRIRDLHCIVQRRWCMGAALPAHVFMRATKRLNGTFLQLMLGVGSSVRRVDTELLTAFRRDRGLNGRETRGAGRAVTIIGRPICQADGLKATPTSLIANADARRPSERDLWRQCELARPDVRGRATCRFGAISSRRITTPPMLIMPFELPA